MHADPASEVPSGVDLDRRIARIEGDRTKNGQALGVPLNEVALGVLRRQAGRHKSHVFTYRGRPLRNANNRAWRKALEECGIGNFRWHDLRHTWATWLRQNDVPTWVLQELGGWKSETMVRRYAHLSVAHLQPFADRLIFSGTVAVVPVPGGEPVSQGHKDGHSRGPAKLRLVASN